MKLDMIKFNKIEINFAVLLKVVLDTVRIIHFHPPSLSI